jgi:hypothetical protein
MDHPWRVLTPNYYINHMRKKKQHGREIGYPPQKGLRDLHSLATWRCRKMKSSPSPPTRSERQRPLVVRYDHACTLTQKTIQARLGSCMRAVPNRVSRVEKNRTGAPGNCSRTTLLSHATKIVISPQYCPILMKLNLRLIISGTCTWACKVATGAGGASVLREPGGGADPEVPTCSHPLYNCESGGHVPAARLCERPSDRTGRGTRHVPI